MNILKKIFLQIFRKIQKTLFINFFHHHIAISWFLIQYWKLYIAFVIFHIFQIQFHIRNKTIWKWWFIPFEVFICIIDCVMNKLKKSKFGVLAGFGIEQGPPVFFRRGTPKTHFAKDGRVRPKSENFLFSCDLELLSFTKIVCDHWIILTSCLMLL